MPIIAVPAVRHHRRTSKPLRDLGRETMIRTRIHAAAVLATCLLATGTFAQEETPQPTPNRIKYQDSKPNAKGTGELATVETRALLSRDGTAALEVTTGNLDTGEASATA